MTPKVRQSIYQLGTIIPALLGLALIWGGIDAGSADSIGQIVAGLVALLGAGAPAVAAGTVSRQRKDGTLDTTSPVDQVTKGVEAVVVAHQNAQAELQRVQDVVTQAVNQVPVLGPLTSQILNYDAFRRP